MAEFFKNKEEVMYFEFTPHGRKVLSEGKFRPVYYSFHDSDILYDGDYAGMSEVQNNVKLRTKETPRLKFGTPNEAGTNKNSTSANDRIPNIEHGTLGRSDFESDYPRFEMVFLENRAASFTGSYDQATGSVFNIPQVGVNYILKEEEELMTQQSDVSDNQITLYMTEYNTRTGRENFEIEIYEKEENGKFIKKSVEDYEGLFISRDKEIINYDELIEKVDVIKGKDDKRFYWIKSLQNVQSEERQARDNIYEIDDPGEACD